MLTEAERERMPPIYQTQRPEIPADLTTATEGQLHDWRTSLAAVIQSVSAQCVARSTEINRVGGLPNMGHKERQEYHRWKRAVAMFRANAEMDLRRVKNEMHQRNLKADEQRAVKKHDWRRLTGDLAEALRNDPAVSLATRHAATVLARAIEVYYAEEGQQ